MKALNRNFFFLILLITGISFSFSTIAFAAYTFVKITDTSSTFQWLDGRPTLNDSGVVAFWAVEKTTEDDGIFTGSGGPLTTVLHLTDTNVQDIWGSKSINNNGFVAVQVQYLQNNTTIEKRKGTTHTKIVSVEGTDFTHLEDPQINDSGVVSFWGEKGDVEGIYTGTGGALTTICDTNAGASFLGFAEHTSIGNDGYVAFAASSGSGADNNTLYKGNGTTRTLIADTTGDFTGVVGECAINNNGVVAFIGMGVNGIFPVQGIYTGSSDTDLTLQVYADMFSEPPTPFMGFSGSPAHNDNGDLAFNALLSTGGSGVGLYTGDDPVADKILEAGDTFDGKEINTITVGRHCINNLGQIAFGLSFTDASMAIYRADPPGTTPVGCPWCPPLYLLLLDQ